MKRFIFCMPGFSVGGAEKVLLQLMMELEKYPDVSMGVIINTPITHPFFAEWFANRPNISVNIITRRMPPKPHGFISKNLWRLRRWFVNMRARQNYRRAFKGADYIIDYLNFGLYSLSVKTRQPLIGFYHSSVNQFVRDNEHKKLKNYTKLVALSNSFVNDFKFFYPALADKITGIYNPINIDDIRQSAAGLQGPGGKYFVVVSRLHWHKDIETVICAFDKFCESENPDCKLYIVGDGDKRTEWQDLTNKMSASDKIIFTGEIPKPFGYMRDAMALIMSSHNEGLPFVLCEAIAVGTLCIASNCKSGTGEIMCSGAGGLMFTPGSVDELAARMSDVYNERVPYDKMIAVATAGLARFAPERIAREIKQMCEAL